MAPNFKDISVLSHEKILENGQFVSGQKFAYCNRPRLLKKASIAFGGSYTTLSGGRHIDLGTLAYNGKQNYSTSSNADNLDNYGWSSMITLWDQNHTPLEIYHPNNNLFSASKMSGDSQYNIAEASNTNYSSFTYSGFESFYTDDVKYNLSSSSEYYEGEVTSAGSERVEKSATFAPKTGSYALKVNPGVTAGNGPSYKVLKIAGDADYLSTGKVDATYQNYQPCGGCTDAYSVVTPEFGVLSGRRYYVSLWSKLGNDATSGVTVTLKNSTGGSTISTFNFTHNQADLTIDGWSRIEGEFEIPSNFPNNGLVEISIINPAGSAAYFDDLIFRPVDASFNAFVFDRNKDVAIYYINAENVHTRIVYDNSGRQTEMHRQTYYGEKITNRTIYGFGKDQ